MSTLKHTPGPWEINAGDLYDFNDADAKLIAAAPELLEALKAILKVITYDIGDPEEKAVDKALLAIKKATE